MKITESMRRREGLMEQKAGLVSTNEALEKEVTVSYAVLKVFTHMFTTNLSFFELFLVLVVNLCKISSQVVTNDMVTFHAKIRKKTMEYQQTLS